MILFKAYFFVFFVTLSFSTDYSIKKGEEVYSKHCWFCHGQRGDGNSDAAAVLKPKPKNFTDPKIIGTLSQARMVKSVMSGRAGTSMPSFINTLSEYEILSVVSFIRQVIMENIKPDKIYDPHTEGFSYIDFNKIDEKSDLKICLLHCHTDVTFIRERLIEFKREKKTKSEK